MRDTAAKGAGDGPVRRHCPHCGRVVAEPNAQICPGCGVRLNPHAAVANPTDRAALMGYAARSLSGRGGVWRIIIVLGAVLLLVAVLLALLRPLGVGS